MRYTIIWERAAKDGINRLRQRDGDAVKPFIRAINGLAVNPEPPESSKLGGSRVRRLRVGRYRATYEVDGDRIAVHLVLVGSVPA
ncbi:type II toxin-antitoxin system RelE family toxin [Streptomyces sp. NBC_00448]|uniref:type II toxin-antitoxin system RelE family toxin n=1 Tax=Streptomyces sp. NBC_00448 TaxID=2903652 RepID=UPI002E22DC04